MDVFVRSALDTDSLAPGLAERAAQESGGNPFLLEQLLRVYRQHGLLVTETGRNWWFDYERADLVSLDLEPQANAQARVAELTPAERDLLARAAAFGPCSGPGACMALGRLGAEPTDPGAVFAPIPPSTRSGGILAGLAERDYVLPLGTSTVAGEAEWTFSMTPSGRCSSAG